jgi:hypothetical protein
MRTGSLLGAVLCLGVAAGLAPGASATMVSSTPGMSATIASSTLAAPTGLGAARGSCVVLTSSSVVLAWTPSASTFADGYEILRSTTSGSGYASIATVAGGATSTYTDTTVGFLTTYFYVVQAKKLAWRSANSNQASVTTPTPLCL